MNSSAASTDDTDVIAQLQRASQRRQRVEDDIADAAPDAEQPVARIEAAANAIRQFNRLFAQYQDSATGTGDFGSYVQFQQEIAELVEGLDEGFPRREAFEAAMDVLDQRRLNERHFKRAREALAPARKLEDLLERREEAREQYRQARIAAIERRTELDDRIDDLTRLRELGEIDLDAPVERLRDPVTAYNDAVREAYQSFARDASARDLLGLFDRAAATPLVEARAPPRDLLEYAREYPAGSNPVPTLLEYADYSASKLDHYVEDPGALRARVATHRTYLERLSADPFTLKWPPVKAGVLRFRTRELLSVLNRFAEEAAIVRLRAVRELPRRDDYDHLRTVATALAELDDDQRERVASGAVSRELQQAQERRDAIENALESAPAL
jgi:hypothetical protein